MYLSMACHDVCSALQVENIGARRLHTVMERLIEDISFEAPDKVQAAYAAAADGGKSQYEEDIILPYTAETAAARAEIRADPEFQATVARCMHSAAEFEARPLAERLQYWANIEEELGYKVVHTIDKQQVREKLQSLLKQDDLSKYIL